jgi:hypothetical protein
MRCAKLHSWHISDAVSPKVSCLVSHPHVVMFTDESTQLPQKRPQSKPATLLPCRRLRTFRRWQRLQEEERDDPPWPGAQQPRLYLSILPRARTQVSTTGQSPTVSDAAGAENQGKSPTDVRIDMCACTMSTKTATTTS